MLVQAYLGAGLPNKIQALLANPETERIVSAASIIEIAIKSETGKISMTESQTLEATRDLCLTVIPFEPRHAYRLFSLPMHHRDPFDRMIITTALSEKITLASGDRWFQGIQRAQGDLVKAHRRFFEDQFSFRAQEGGASAHDLLRVGAGGRCAEAADMLMMRSSYKVFPSYEGIESAQWPRSGPCSLMRARSPAVALYASRQAARHHRTVRSALALGSGRRECALSIDPGAPPL